jgi:hypothetical protein
MVIISSKITLDRLVLSDTGVMAGLMADIIPIIIIKTTIIITILSPAHARCRATVTRAAAGQAIMGITTTALQTGAAGKATMSGKDTGIMTVASTKTTVGINNVSLVDKPFLKTLNSALSHRRTTAQGKGPLKTGLLVGKHHLNSKPLGIKTR